MQSLNPSSNLNHFDVISEINTYQPRSPGIEMPSEVKVVRELREKKKMSDEEYCRFFAQEHIKQWLNAKWDADLYNRDSFLRLWEIYQRPRLTDPGKAGVVGKLAQFLRFINSNDKPVLALRLNFKDYPFDDPGQRQIDELNQQIRAFEN